MKPSAFCKTRTPQCLEFSSRSPKGRLHLSRPVWWRERWWKALRRATSSPNAISDFFQALNILSSSTTTTTGTVSQIGTQDTSTLDAAYLAGQGVTGTFALGTTGQTDGGGTFALTASCDCDYRTVLHRLADEPRHDNDNGWRSGSRSDLSLGIARALAVRTEREAFFSRVPSLPLGEIPNRPSA